MALKKICTICVRGGSKGVVGKNLRLIRGFPLIAFSLIQAKQTKEFDEIAVSSDSDELLEIAKNYGATITIKRPSKMALDNSPKLPAIRHCVEEVERQVGKFDLCIDLDATSPLRSCSDIKEVIKLLSYGGANVVTGALARRSPYFNLLEEKPGNFVGLIKPNSDISRRQDAPQCFDMNASIYGWLREDLRNATSVITGTTKIYLMPEERSVDIDTHLDFDVVEMLISKRFREKRNINDVEW